MNGNLFSFLVKEVLVNLENGSMTHTFAMS